MLRCVWADPVERDALVIPGKGGRWYNCRSKALEKKGDKGQGRREELARGADTFSFLTQRRAKEAGVDTGKFSKLVVETRDVVFIRLHLFSL